MEANLKKEHDWLRQLEGDWINEAECQLEPGVILSGRETVRSLGGAWVVGEGQGQMPGGGTSITMITLGYDPLKKKFVGSWVGSMMTNMWIYEGSLDESGKVLTLDTEGPVFGDESKTAKYQDVVEFLSDDHRTLTGRVQGEDGVWTQLMIAHYRRVK